MAKVTLEKDYLWNGVVYAAGEEVEVPDSFVAAYNLEVEQRNSEPRGIKEDLQPSSSLPRGSDDAAPIGGTPAVPPASEGTSASTRLTSDFKLPNSPKPTRSRKPKTEQPE